MAKSYFMRFGSGDPRSTAGLAPTLVVFSGPSGTTFAGPAVSEIYAGAGIYTFSYGTTSPIAWIADGFTTSLGTQGRYVAGSCDPADRADEYGNTLIAIGNTLTANSGSGGGSSLAALGTTLIAIGNTSIALGITSGAYGATNVALGLTSIALETLILGAAMTLTGQNSTLGILVAGLGSTASSYGTEFVDPVDAFGYLKRILENLEGDNNFTKLTGVLNIYSRGSTTLLRAKTVQNTFSNVTKTGL